MPQAKQHLMRTSQTTEDNFKEIQMINGDLRQFKDKVRTNGSSARQQEILELQAKKANSNHRHSMSGKMGKKNHNSAEKGSTPPAETSTHNSKDDKERPKTADIEPSEEEKRDMTKKPENALKDAKWISTYGGKPMKQIVHDSSLERSSEEAASRGSPSKLT